MHTLALPAAWIVDLLGLPHLLGAPAFYIANAFLLTTLLLAWRVFATWWQSRYVFYLFLYVYLLVFGILGYQATVQLSLFWVYALIWIAVSLILALRLHQKKPLAREAHRMLSGFAIAGSIICIGLPVSYGAFHTSLQNRIDAQLTEQTSVERAALIELSETTRAKAQALALDPTISTVAQSGSSEALVATLQSRMVQDELQFITITDPLGTVLLRTSIQDGTGDNLFSKSGWAVPLFTTSTPVYGLAYNEKNLPTILAGEPILTVNKEVAGYLIAGRFINQDYVSSVVAKRSINFAIMSENGTIRAAASDPKLTAVLQSADMSEQLGELISSNGDLSAKVDANDTTYILHAISLTTLNPQQSLVLATAAIDPNPAVVNQIARIVGIVGLVLLVAWLSFRKARGGRKPA